MSTNSTRSQPTDILARAKAQLEYSRAFEEETGERNYSSEGLVPELVAEIERLRKGIQDMLDGNYPHPRTYRSSPGMECPHGIPYYQDCGACNDAWLQGLLS